MKRKREKERERREKSNGERGKWRERGVKEKVGDRKKRDTGRERERRGENHNRCTFRGVCFYELVNKETLLKGTKDRKT